MTLKHKTKEEFEQMSIDEIMDEVKSISLHTQLSKENMLWTMYESLSVGSVFEAAVHIRAHTKMWYECTEFEDLIASVDVSNKPYEIFPELEEKETIMFLGMSEKTYPYKQIDGSATYRRGRSRRYQNVIAVSERKYPTWLVKEKVKVYPLDLTQFNLLIVGSGSRHKFAKKVIEKSKSEKSK